MGLVCAIGLCLLIAAVAVYVLLGSGRTDVTGYTGPYLSCTGGVWVQPAPATAPEPAGGAS